MVKIQNNNKINTDQNINLHPLKKGVYWIHDNLYHPIANRFYDPLHTFAELFKTSEGAYKVSKVVLVFLDAWQKVFTGASGSDAVDALNGCLRIYNETIVSIAIFQRPKDLIAADKNGQYLYEKRPFHIVKMLTLTIGNGLRTIYWITRLALKRVSEYFIAVSSYCSIIESSIELGIAKKKLEAYRLDPIRFKDPNDKEVQKKLTILKKNVEEAHHKAKKCWLDIANCIAKIGCIILAAYIGGTWAFIVLGGIASVTALWKTIHDLKIKPLSSAPLLT